MLTFCAPVLATQLCAFPGIETFLAKGLCLGSGGFILAWDRTLILEGNSFKSNAVPSQTSFPPKSSWGSWTDFQRARTGLGCPSTSPLSFEALLCPSPDPTRAGSQSRESQRASPSASSGTGLFGAASPGFLTAQTLQIQDWTHEGKEQDVEALARGRAGPYLFM